MEEQQRQVLRAGGLTATSAAEAIPHNVPVVGSGIAGHRVVNIGQVTPSSGLDGSKLPSLPQHVWQGFAARSIERYWVAANSSAHVTNRASSLSAN